MTAVGKCRCGATFSGNKVNHCTICHHTFTTWGNGDKHRTGEGAGRYCVPPEDVGLLLNDRGYWASPGRTR